MTAEADPTVSDLQSWLSQQLASIEARGQHRARSVTRSGPGWSERNGRRLVDFANNDYLGLAHHPRVRKAFAEVAAGTVGAGASALVTGRTEWHERLEQTIADFEGTEAALVFPSGYAANVGTLSALMNSDDIVFSDRLNHASLIDGCRLSGARLRVFRNDQLGKLNERLTRTDRAAEEQRTFIVTDAVFSMDGTIAPLAELCHIAERHGVTLIVDEAHGTGVLGERGRGACEFHGVEERVAVRIGTLSKAIGCLGGFVAGSRELIDYLWNSARSQFFSTALPPAVCAAAATAFEVLCDEPALREQMRANTQLLVSLISPAGAAIPCSEPDTGVATIPIVPIVVGPEEATLDAAQRVEDDGFLVACVRPPTVPNDSSRLRISVSANHTEEDIKRLAESVNRAVASVQRGNR